MDTKSLLDSLNERQREAVLENGRPLLVLAGAGSGKTRVITTKIAYAIRELGIPSWNILALTFTNKAANEMKERVLSLVGDNPRDSYATIRTFHSFGAMVLRRFADKAGLSPSFSIYDDDDSLSILKRTYPFSDAKTLRHYARRISLCKDRGMTVEALRRDPDELLHDLYVRYQRELDATGNVDFADLIIKLGRVLGDPTVASWAHERYRMVLVDEYQDTNMSQFRALRKLVGPEALLTIVGDDDQSIYKFRGAEATIFEAFRKSFPTSRTIMLEQNYRSTSAILSVANKVIVNNHKSGDVKKLWTERKGGERPECYVLPNEVEEAKTVASLIRERGDWDNTAVLYRTNAQSGAFENVFTSPEFHIPYKVVGALKFYDREQVKDGISLMHLLCNPHDVVSFSRMVNKPARGMGKKAVGVIEASIREEDGNCLKALEKAPLTGSARKGADAFLSLLRECRALVDGGNLAEALALLFQKSGLVALYREQDMKAGRGEEDDGSRAADFDTLVTQASRYGNDLEALESFLETLALDTTTIGYIDPREKPGVTLITVHNTKGLEFNHVYVVGLEDGLFPSILSLSENPGCEEERRLFYVAVTRAKETLVLTEAKSRRSYGSVHSTTPSRFLREVGEGMLNWHVCEDDEDGDDWYDDDYASSSARYGRRSSGSYRGMDSMGERRLRREKEKEARGTMIRRGFGGNSKSFSYQVVHREKEDGSPLFNLGQRVYSDKYGPGTVESVRKSGGPEVVDVRFDSGRSATFISKFAKLEKIED